MTANGCDKVTCCDSELSEQLLQEDPEQFYTLVRMHLSFVLDLSTDDCDGSIEKTKFKPLKWNFLSKKPKGSLKGVIEKLSLTEEGLAQIAQLMEFLSKTENISQEGIFRVTGALSRQNKLKSLINQGLSFNLEDGQFSVHDCASVLKSFLSELPEPLLSETYFPAYVQISELCVLGDSAKNRLLRSLQLLLLLLPSRNRAFLKDIIKLLNLTASYESKNKMSPENLATLFTPHLLCPRKLSPEALHSNSQKLSRVLVFMIQAGLDLFEVPPTLATDIRAYWVDKNKIQSAEIFKESRAVNTVFSFVDRVRTAQENTLNPTEEALAQLYAHIQSMPESSKKRRLVKQFNKENGQGTPRQFSSNKGPPKSKGLGDSIKKHILNKNGKDIGKNDFDSKRDKVLNQVSENKCLPQNSSGPTAKYSAEVNSPQNKDDIKTSSIADKFSESNEGASVLENRKEALKETQTNTDQIEVSKPDFKKSLQPERRQDEELSSCGSPIQIGPASNDVHCMDELSEKSLSLIENPQRSDPSWNQFFSPSVQFHHKGAVKAFPYTPINISAPPRSCHMTINKFGNFTSTPACKTPSPLLKDDMSPITLSAQKMTKAMQETMMTPRCRKPVIAISDSNLSNLTDIPWSPSRNSSESNNYATKYNKNSDGSQTSNTSHNSQTKNSKEDAKEENLSDSAQLHDSNSLADTFYDYLYSRSILTASPVDLSFSSRTGDFEHSSCNTLSLSDETSMMTNCDDKSALFSDEERISHSLLYFLDGNEPPLGGSSAESSSSRKRSASDIESFSPVECLKNSLCDSVPKKRNSKVTSSETSL